MQVEGTDGASFDAVYRDGVEGSEASTVNLPRNLLWGLLDAKECPDRSLPRDSIAGAADTDGTDGAFGTPAHSNHSGPCPAFTREGDLNAQGLEEGLRPPLPGERPRQIERDEVGWFKSEPM
jgi:hypothetical protein